MISLDDIITIHLCFENREYRMAAETDVGDDRCRSKVWVVCYEKPSHMLLDLETETADKFLIDGYKSIHPDFSCGICTGCSITLSKKHKDADFEIPVSESYDPKRMVELRLVDTCS